MGKSFSLKKGFTINLVGEAEQELHETSYGEIAGVKPDDFYGVNPKLLLKEGAEVKAGEALFFDKNMDSVSIPSPVSGEIVEIERGAKRKILTVKILADKKIEYVKNSIPQNLNADSIKKAILDSNCWYLIKQRPFNTIADPAGSPKAIYVTTFDTAPLAADLEFVISQQKEAFDKGLEVLEILSGGNLNVSKSPESSLDIKSGDVHTFSGKHPAGNVGVQIHHIDPIKKGEVVWHVNAQDVCVLGNLFLKGTYEPNRIIALAGSEVNSPSYYKMRVGQSLKTVLEEQVANDNIRVIQGDVLTGAMSSKEDYLSAYTNTITCLEEGNKSEFLGWLIPKTNKLSQSRSFLSWLMPNKVYDLDTNTHGELRPFVVTGEYEKVLPMNIMPVQLLKSILANDLERMEALGIYELAEEDLALCEFVCSSKIEVQRILRQGLDTLKEEG